MQDKKHISVLILAAGTSSRLGEPKQLLKLEEKELLWHATKKALDFSSDVTVVLGHKYEECKKALEGLNIKILRNPNYKDGLASSISYGVTNLDSCENILIMLCDQPLIPNEHYHSLIENYKKDSQNIVATKYNSNLGVPAIFPKKYFESLKKLKGDKGAKSLLIENKCTFIQIEKNHAQDIDTKEDWERVLNTLS